MVLYNMLRPKFKQIIQLFEPLLYSNEALENEKFSQGSALESFKRETS